MANVNFTNLTKSYTMWSSELNPSSFAATPNHLELMTNGNTVVIAGSGLTYSPTTSAPQSGHIDRVTFSLAGNATSLADIDITNVDADFGAYADVLASANPTVKTTALWTATLSGNDTIDFGVNAKNYDITFAGDGYVAPAVAYGGNDKFRGSPGYGTVIGDYGTATQEQTVFAGNDDIRVMNGNGAYVVGDVYWTWSNSKVIAGNDFIQVAKSAVVLGDVFEGAGLVHGGNDSIMGSGQDDVIVGDAYTVNPMAAFRGGADEIHGGGAGDLIYGDHVANYAGGNARGGNDKLYGDAGSDTISGNGGNDYIEGGADGDSLMGDEGNDVVRGGTGQDSIYGGAGIDVADYRDRSHKVEVKLDLYGGGPVKVNGVAEDYLDSIEDIYGGSANDVLVGYAASGDNLFDGRGGNDIVSGAGGRDTLIGGAGSDKLAGGSEADQFRFNVKLGTSNIDRILDFVHNLDEIALDNAIFKALGSSFTADEFVAKSSGHLATNASQHIIYDKSNGTLWYDSDGKGGHAAVQFAQLGTSASHPTNLTWDDFAIV